MSTEATRHDDAADETPRVGLPGNDTVLADLIGLHTLTLLHDDPVAIAPALSERASDRRRRAREAAAALMPAMRAPVVGAIDSDGDDSGEAASVVALGAALAQAYRQSHDGYEGMLGEMAALGRAALVNSVRTVGRSSDDERRDALRLLRGVLDHPIGGRNPHVWLAYATALLRDFAPRADAEEAFHHAQRLSAPGQPEHELALRFLACLHVGDARPQEALAEIEPAAARAGASVAVLLEAASVALAAGRDDRAADWIDQAIAADPSATVDVLANPGLAALHGAAARELVRLTEAAREATREAGGRLAAVRAVAADVAQRLGAPFAAPDEAMATIDASHLGLSAARRLADDLDATARERAAVLRDALEAEQRRATDEAQRLQRFLENALRERDYWESSVRSIEEEARTGGYALHPYTLYNPFQRKKKVKSEQLRQHHEQCKANHEQSVAFLANQEPRVRRDIARNVERREQTEVAMARLAAIFPPTS